jgi:6,7-dimethyl-8-ribityllumazine synthase
VPVIFGVLTTDTVEQALDRAGGEDGESVATPRAAVKGRSGAGPQGNSGYSAAAAAIEMANLMRDLESP